MIHSDFHVHTHHDHGQGSPAAIVREALRYGIPALGLVGHGRMRFACDYAMTPASEAALFSEVSALKDEYAGQIDLFCGVELDYYSLPADLPYDYRIGSVHYVLHDGRPISVDSDPRELCDAVQQCYGGVWKQLYEAYYQTVASVADQTGADIIGHFDLITKFNETGVLFSPDDPAYRRAALEALEVLIRKDCLFEINTGAISRGYRTTPYPARWLLQAIHDQGGRIILSSDAHTPATLLYQFRQSAELAADCGFRSAWVLTREGFQEQPL